MCFGRRMRSFRGRTTDEIENGTSYLLGGTRLNFDRDLTRNGTIDTAALARTKIDRHGWAIQLNAPL